MWAWTCSKAPKRPCTERLSHVPELEQVFQRAMESISAQANQLLVDYVDFSGVAHLVDVGGGNGANIIRLARAYPRLKASVSIHRRCAKWLAATSPPRACRIASEPCRGTVLPTRSRPAWTASSSAISSRIWSEERNRELLRKAHAALEPGGAVIIFNMMQADDERGPLTAAMGSPYFLTLATGEGMLYTWSEDETWMREAAFSRVVRRAFIRNHGVIIGLKWRARRKLNRLRRWRTPS